MRYLFLALFTSGLLFASNLTFLKVQCWHTHRSLETVQ